MKTRRWLDLAEYASLVGLGVGAIASHLSAQLLYTSAPLSFALVLNLINRRRLMEMSDQSKAIAIQELDQKLTKHVELLSQQVVELPTPEDVSRVKKALLSRNEEIRDQLSHHLQDLQQQVTERFAFLEEQDLSTVRQDITSLEEQQTYTRKIINDLTGEVKNLSSSERVEALDRLVEQMRTDTDQMRLNLQVFADQTKPGMAALQEQINHLNRQFQKLPPPFDSTALKQEVDELIRMVSELVPKRDWSNLMAEMKALHQRQESQAQSEETLRRKIQDLNQQMQSRPVKSNLTSLQNQINHLNRQFQKLPPPFDPTSLKQEVTELIQSVADRIPKRDLSALATQIKALQRQQDFQAQVEETLRRELQDIHQQIQQFVAGDHTAPAESASTVEETDVVPQRQFQARIEATLQRELVALDQQFRHLPSGPQLQAEIENLLRRELQEINQQLRTYPSDPHYELVFDFKSDGSPGHEQAGEGAIASSRVVLEEALATTQERLILIWPWSSQCSLDRSLVQRIEQFLRRGGQLHLGWCDQAERHPRFLSSINQRWGVHSRHPELQSTLQLLLRLKQSYPSQFQFQILGTTENFMVSDTSFAVLGTDESLTDNTLFSELELKLRTTDPDVIQQLIHRFDHPVLHPQDGVGYWNRAVTRYDLGDKEGALADFNQVLAIHPQDVVAYNYRGLVRFDLGDKEGAVVDFSHALDLNPQLVSVYCNRGYVLSELGDQLGAMADYSLAIQYQPDSAIAYFYRGLAGQKYGDIQAAFTDYSEAIHLAPDAAPAYYYRGAVQQKLDNLEGAIADFEAAVRLFHQRGNTANAQKAEKNLIKLRKTLAARPSSSTPIPAAGDGAISTRSSEEAIAPMEQVPSPVTNIRAVENDPADAVATSQPDSGHRGAADIMPPVDWVQDSNPAPLGNTDQNGSTSPSLPVESSMEAIADELNQLRTGIIDAAPPVPPPPDEKKPIVFETIDSFFRDIDTATGLIDAEGNGVIGLPPEESVADEANISSFSLAASNHRLFRRADEDEDVTQPLTNGAATQSAHSSGRPTEEGEGNPLQEAVTLSDFFEFGPSHSGPNGNHSNHSSGPGAVAPEAGLQPPTLPPGLPQSSPVSSSNSPVDSETLSDFRQRF